MKASHLLVLAALSGFAAVPLIYLMDSSSEISPWFPGLIYGLMFFIWLPGLDKASWPWRLGAVVLSGAAYVSAQKVAMEVYVSGHMSLRSLAFPLAGFWGALLLSAYLMVKMGRPYAWKRLLWACVAGGAFGWVYSNLWTYMNDEIRGAYAFACGQSQWQLGVGYFLLQQARKNP